MSTNKTTPTRGDLVSKDCVSIVLSEEHISNYELPNCILDIRYTKISRSFTFIVSMRNRYDIKTPNVVSFNFEKLDFEHRFWLLAKFKMHLRGLNMIEKLNQWVLDRFLLLKEYCDINDISFDSLYIKSALPPVKVSSHCVTHVCVSKTREDAHFNNERHVKQKSEGDKKKCLSVVEVSVMKPIRVTLSKAVRRRIVHNRIQAILKKHSTRKSIDKDTFLQDLESVRLHLYDM